MSLLSVRLTKELDKQLDAEAKQSNKKRAELVREALTAYLRAHERKRFMDEMVSEIHNMSAEERYEAVAVAEEALPFDNEALHTAEGNPQRKR